MIKTESPDWAICKLLETADSRLLTRRIVDMAMDSARKSSEITRASNIFPDVMFREIAYKYGHVTKQFEIDLYNAYALATQKAETGSLTLVDIRKLAAMAYFGNCQ